MIKVLAEKLMKNYYDAYVELNLKVCQTWDEIADSKCRRKHNRAMTRIYELDKTMVQESDRGVDIVLRLLAHEDERVRMCAGSYCIFAQIHVEAGKEALASIAKTSESSYMRLVAKQNLEYRVPFSPQDNS